MKKIRYIIEACVLWVFLAFFGLFTPQKASNIGGYIGRMIGPRLAATRKAIKNIQDSFPDKSEQDCKKIAEDMWENLGRVMAEYPHLKTIAQNHLEIVGREHFEKIGKDGRCILIGCHAGNWEIYSFFFNYALKWPVSSVYREPNNPYTAALLEKCRHADDHKGAYIPKSSKGARDMVKVMQDSGKLGILIDQKYNKGLAVPFFGRPAMTSETFAVLAQKFDCPILPIRVERMNGCNYRVTIEPALEQAQGDIFETVRRAHTVLERWISEHPGQWLWLHRRWDSKSLKNLSE